MLAILNDDKYARGSIAFLAALQKIKGSDFGPPSHPSVSDRLAQAKSIIFSDELTILT